jgi:hypothetical protein
MRRRRPAARVDPLLPIWLPFSCITYPISNRAVLYEVYWSKIDASLPPLAAFGGRG